MVERVRGQKRGEIYEIIKKAGKISLDEIRAKTDVNPNTIRSTVISLTKQGLIERVGKGVYRLKSK